MNQTLKTGIFPEALKIATAKPLYKKGDNFCLNPFFITISLIISA